MQRASDRLRKWRKKNVTNFRDINSLRNTLCPRTRQAPAVNDRANDLDAPCAPVCLSRHETSSSRCRAKRFHQAKPCHLLACFTRLLSANTILDPSRESFQLSGRNPIRCIKHKRTHASLVHSCSCSVYLVEGHDAIMCKERS